MPKLCGPIQWQITNSSCSLLLCLVLFRHQLPKSMMKHSCDIIMKDVSWEVSANVYWAFLHLCSCWLASWKKKKSHPRATSSLKIICSSWWSHDIAQMLSGGRNSLITAMKFSENMFFFFLKSLPKTLRGISFYHFCQRNLPWVLLWICHVHYSNSSEFNTAIHVSKGIGRNVFVGVGHNF